MLYVDSSGYITYPLAILCGIVDIDGRPLDLRPNCPAARWNRLACLCTSKEEPLNPVVQNANTWVARVAQYQ